MANEKLTWVELRKAVAQTANVTEQEAGQFMAALLEAIIEGLKEDKQVKIKGLGTFALKQVAARKSVNIATGEDITIEGYNKLVFNAEAMLKESVEKRLDSPKTADLIKELSNDPIKKLGEQADEIVDILTELGQAVKTENGKVKTENEEIEPTEEPVEEVVEEIVEEEKPIAEEPTNKPTCKPTCKCHKWVCWVIGALLLLGIVGTGIYFRATLIQWWQCMQDCQPTIEAVEEVSEVQEVLEVEEVALADQTREYVNFLGIERVGEDSRLAWIAYKYYAQKDLWVFIYEANRDIIAHPSHVLPGQYIRIPDLDEKYRNLYNPELRQLVDSLAKEYLKK